MATDLHLHSWKSDGQMPPREVVANAQRLGITLMALTDHDTMAGLGEASEAARRAGIRPVPGIEVTACRSGPGTEEVHILGYFVGAENRALASLCEEIRRRQRERLAAQIERLRAAGREVTLSEVESSAPHTQALDRPHLARIMVQRGWVPSSAAAFQRHLGPGGDCHVPLEGPSLTDAIQTIRAAGGIAVLAHPRFFNHPRGASRETVAPLVEAGLGGIEVYHSRHTPEEIERFAAIAEECDLVISGGSDCHGRPEADGRLPIEHLMVPDWVGPQFLARCEGLPGFL